MTPVPTQPTRVLPGSALLTAMFDSLGGVSGRRSLMMLRRGVGTFHVPGVKWCGSIKPCSVYRAPDVRPPPPERPADPPAPAGADRAGPRPARLRQPAPRPVGPDALLP